MDTYMKFLCLAYIRICIYNYVTTQVYLILGDDWRW